MPQGAAPGGDPDTAEAMMGALEQMGQAIGQLNDKIDQMGQDFQGQIEQLGQMLSQLAGGSGGDAGRFSITRR